MAKFKSHLLELVLEKQKELGRQITKAEIARETELAYTTIDRWWKSEVDRIDAVAVSRLCKFLNCEMGELVELVDRTPLHTHLVALP